MDNDPLACELFFDSFVAANKSLQVCVDDPFLSYSVIVNDLNIGYGQDMPVKNNSCKARGLDGLVYIFDYPIRPDSICLFFSLFLIWRI